MLIPFCTPLDRGKHRSMLSLTLAAVVLLAAQSRAADAERIVEDKRVDRAIERALAFLAITQDRTDGAWRSRSSKNPAITSLAIMAFLSAGHVPGEGKYGPVIEKGIRRVLKFQQPNGLIASENSQEMYHHGISTLMLAEVAGMTDGPLGDEVRAALERAVAIILKAQRTSGPARGGWRYQVAHIGGSDISVTGWQIMALRAAKNLGCDVPPSAIERAIEFIQRCQKPSNNGFRYSPNDDVTIPCTGTSILALELCGKELHHSPEVLKAGSFLIREENLPRWGNGHFFYGVYYGSQATFQLGGNYWAVYRPRLREVVLENQQSNGSWSGGPIDSSFGPAYCTSMAVLALTVEYRFLPIYQRSEECDDRKP
jgi:hypothetical protein